MVEVHDIDQTGQVVPVRKLPDPPVCPSIHLEDLIFGEDKVPVEISSEVQNGSIVVGIGKKDKRYYIVKTIDIVLAAYLADRARPSSNQVEKVRD